MRQECIEAAVRAALAWLQTLAVISEISEAGARSVVRILENLEQDNLLSSLSSLTADGDGLSRVMEPAKPSAIFKLG